MTNKSLAGRFRGRGPLLNIVLDGWGIGDQSEGDAIFQAHTPVVDGLMEQYATSQILTHGHHVGLPSPKDLGGSEVGHMTLGAGRVVPQGPTRILELLKSGEFFRGEVITKLIRNCLENDSPLHLIGLLSDGNIHSHISHFFEVIRHASGAGVRRVFLHVLLDGRDVGYQSALEYVEPLEALLAGEESKSKGREYAIASGGGREVLTMDRDRNWAKVKLGWEVHVRGRGAPLVETVSGHIRQSRDEKPEMIDQDLPPFVVGRQGRPVGPIGDGHSVIFMNFRGDRAWEFSQAMVDPEFAEFDRGGAPRVVYAGMAVYDEDRDLPPMRLVSTPKIADPFGRRIHELGLRQFRLAETQKYAHVTFFFNGGYGTPLDESRETYRLIQSDRLDSFAEKPEMKAAEVGRQAVAFLRDGGYDFGLINFANTDMVGHTGDLTAVARAAEAVDRALGEILPALDAVDGLALITADHGNGEEMITLNASSGRREPNTRHSINPVPVVLYDPRYREDGAYQLRPNEEPVNTLANVLATNYILLGREPPDDVEQPLFLKG